MVFMGRGRGRGTSQFASKTGGAISATTRKEKRPTEKKRTEIVHDHPCRKVWVCKDFVLYLFNMINR